jgi:carboxyl-terminal processing protease
VCGLFPHGAAPVVCVSRLFQRFVFVLSVAIFAALGLGFAMGEFGLFGVHAGGQQDGAYRQMRVYAEVLKKVQTDYVTEPNIDNVTTGALHGLLESLDADSSYLTPTEYKIYKDRPAAGVAQVGLTVSKRYGYAVVVSVLPGSAAADGAHRRRRRHRVHRRASPPARCPCRSSACCLEGKPGTTVTLSVVRPRKAEPDKLTLTRSIADLPALAEQQYESATILYLKPGALTAARVDEIAARLKAAPKSEKVLLDLRDSAGGDEQEGLRLANFFVKQGTLATLEGQRFPRQTFTADPAKCHHRRPVADVLVNRGTFGPAELTAAAIEDLKRGDVVGERTFGEGSVQKTIDLPGGAALLLTVAKYEGPDGKKIQDEAVTPTVLVGLTPEEEDEEVAPPSKGDEPLTKALELLKAKNG